MTYMDFAVEGRSDHQSKENFATWEIENGHDWGLRLFMKPVSANTCGRMACGNDDFCIRVRHRDYSNIHGIGWGSVVIVILNNDKWQPIVIIHGVIGWKRTIQFFVMVESQTSPALC